MKKKLILIVALLVALAVSVGTYAATYTLATAMVPGSIAGARIATTAAAGGQPNWNSLLPHSEVGQLILRPNAPGDTTKIQGQQPSAGAHWDKVADGAPDDWATTVYTTSGSARLDLYNLADHGMGNGAINGVTVYFRFTATDGGTADAQAAIRMDETTYRGDVETQAGPAFVTRSYTWGTNPETDTAWTWDDIDDLQAGVELDRVGGGSANAVCTQVYVVVDYTTLPIVSGAVPMGNLFTVTPSGNYTGDLMVKVYLTNTGALLKAYKFLNMKVYLPGSLEAAQNPNYQVLSMENGVLIFNIDGGAAPSYTVQISGGSYAVLSGNTNDWSPGWSITPEFYCEVTQR